MSNRVVTIERLAYGPHGVARDEGKVLFVRNAVPGDVMEVVIDEDHGTYAYASPTQLKLAGADRRLPPCRFLPRCGGCPWQQVDYAAQLRAKQANVEDHLRRIAGVTLPPVRPIVASPAELAYRGRLGLRVDRREVGFFAAASHDLVPIDRCLLGEDGLNEALPDVARLVSQLRSRVRRVELVRASTSTGDPVALVGEVEGALAAGDDATIEARLTAAKRMRGVTLHGKGWRRTWGDDRIEVAPQEDLILHARAGAFTQVNPRANQILVAQVLQLGGFTAGDHVLDAYAGIGNLSFPIARHAALVVAVEQDPQGARAAQENRRRLGASNVEVVHDSTRRLLARWAQQSRQLDVLVVDPPRGGIPEVIDLILQLAPARLLYVSCNPSTLARDLKRLLGAYRLDVVQPIDMFPHTYHVEVVAHCTRTRS